MPLFSRNFRPGSLAARQVRDTLTIYVWLHLRYEVLMLQGDHLQARALMREAGELYNDPILSQHPGVDPGEIAHRCEAAAQEWLRRERPTEN